MTATLAAAWSVLRKIKIDKNKSKAIHAQKSPECYSTFLLLFSFSFIWLNTRFSKAKKRELTPTQRTHNNIYAIFFIYPPNKNRISYHFKYLHLKIQTITSTATASAPQTGTTTRCQTRRRQQQQINKYTFQSNQTKSCQKHTHTQYYDNNNNNAVVHAKYGHWTSVDKVLLLFGLLFAPKIGSSAFRSDKMGRSVESTFRTK